MKKVVFVAVVAIRTAPAVLFFAAALLLSFGLFDPRERGIEGQHAIVAGITCGLLGYCISGISIRGALHIKMNGGYIAEAFVVVSLMAAVLLTFLATVGGPWWFAWIFWSWVVCFWGVRKTLYPTDDELRKYAERPQVSQQSAFRPIVEYKPLPIDLHHVIKIEK